MTRIENSVILLKQHELRSAHTRASGEHCCLKKKANAYWHFLFLFSNKNTAQHDVDDGESLRQVCCAVTRVVIVHSAASAFYCVPIVGNFRCGYLGENALCFAFILHLLALKAN